ncbi:uncharacterized protein LAESUDRAFT_809069 [Laetiporus sulphureus 93-53]|uniref:Uncharacterized protein n=1 Tax=Laetiporus sulphureus 93-53 TaxID=1314785 RepID=A0A165HVS0_9APHY|nr:uncharacterized protein LAESUDRAFT_809069 [Laetiporus sulphureus 93-53]KZT12256.1 hypothetical protein LAESUDRAFT_809069 [Laetiporus sulphureus 93-53]
MSGSAEAASYIDVNLLSSPPDIKCDFKDDDIQILGLVDQEEQLKLKMEIANATEGSLASDGQQMNSESGTAEAPEGPEERHSSHGSDVQAGDASSHASTRGSGSAEAASYIDVDLLDSPAAQPDVKSEYDNDDIQILGVTDQEGQLELKMEIADAMVKRLEDRLKFKDDIAKAKLEQLEERLKVEEHIAKAKLEHLEERLQLQDEISQSKLDRLEMQLAVRGQEKRPVKRQPTPEASSSGRKRLRLK